jgi:hypothetical protein
MKMTAAPWASRRARNRRTPNVECAPNVPRL